MQWPAGPRPTAAAAPCSTRDDQGQWRVAACGGDGMKDAQTLQSSGMPAADALQLSRRLQQAEATLPAERRARFSSFDGVMRMPAGGHHGHEAQP